MTAPLVRLMKGTVVSDEWHLPPDGKVDVKKETKDGQTVYVINQSSDSFDEVPNSEREARIPVIHAHAPGDLVNPVPDLVQEVKVKAAGPTAATEVPGDVEIHKAKPPAFGPSEAQPKAEPSEKREEGAVTSGAQAQTRGRKSTATKSTRSRPTNKK